MTGFRPAYDGGWHLAKMTISLPDYIYRAAGMKNVHLKNCKKVNRELRVEIGAAWKGANVIAVPGSPGPRVVEASSLPVCEICIG